MIDIIYAVLAIIIMLIVYICDSIFGTANGSSINIKMGGKSRPNYYKKRRRVLGRFDKKVTFVGGREADYAISTKVQKAVNKYGEKNVIEHFEGHFDISDKDKKSIKKSKLSYVQALTDFIVANYEVEGVEDFIEITGFSQFAFLPRQKAHLLADAYRHMEVSSEDIKEIRKVLDKYINLYDVSLKRKEVSTDIIIKHRFYAIKDKMLNKTAAQLKKLIKKNPRSVFQIDKDPYVPIARKIVLEKLNEKTDQYPESILQQLRKYNPKLYPLSEIKGIYTIKDLVDYLRRKILFSDKDLYELSDNIRAYKRRIKNLEETIFVLQNELRDAKNKKSTVVNDNNDLLNQILDENEALKRRVEELSQGANVEHLQRSLNELQKMIVKLRTELLEVKEENAELKRQKESIMEPFEDEDDSVSISEDSPFETLD